MTFEYNNRGEKNIHRYIYVAAIGILASANIAWLLRASYSAMWFDSGALRLFPDLAWNFAETFFQIVLVFFWFRISYKISDFRAKVFVPILYFILLFISQLLLAVLFVFGPPHWLWWTYWKFKS